MGNTTLGYLMNKQYANTFTRASIDTPLGPMLAIADEDALILLEFIDQKNHHKHLERLQVTMNASFIESSTSLIDSITQELGLYFAGKLKTFTAALKPHGTPFQKKVWQELQKIPYGQTISYAQLAHNIGNEAAVRAVASANAANQLALIIPCHRVIHKNGNLAGYAAGIARKEWLLNHERGASKDFYI